jgi:hypothetical protein
MSDAHEIEPFTKEGLVKRLIKFVSSDDQVRHLFCVPEEPSLTKVTVNQCCRKSEFSGVAHVCRRRRVRGGGYTSPNKVQQRNYRGMETGT